MTLFRTRLRKGHASKHIKIEVEMKKLIIKQYVKVKKESEVA